MNETSIEKTVEENFVSTKQQANDRFRASIDGNRPTALEAIKRSDYKDDDSYIEALAVYEYETTNVDPRLAALRRKYSRLVYEENEAKRQAAQEAAYEKVRENTRLDYTEQKTVEKAAADEATRLLKAGRIEAKDLAKTAADLQKQMEDKAIRSKAGGTFFNQLMRQEYQAQKGITPEEEKRMSKDLKTDLMGKKNAW